MLKNPNIKEKQYLYVCALKGQGKGDSLDGCMLNVRERRDIIHIAIIPLGTRRKVKMCLTYPEPSGGRLCVAGK